MTQFCVATEAEVRWWYHYSLLCPMMSWHVRNGMHVCLMFFLSLTFATFTFWGLFNCFCQLSCVHSVISCFIKPFNHQPPKKMPRYFVIHAHVIPLTLFPCLWAEWRRRHVKKFLTLSRPLLFPLPNKDEHCNTGKRERKGGAENGEERERDSKKSHDLLWMWLPPLLPF